MLKRSTLVVFVLTLLVARVRAEPQFPDWDKICPEDQRSWGLEVRRSTPSSNWLAIKIPAKVAPFFTKAEVILKHREGGGSIKAQCGFEIDNDNSKLLQLQAYDRSFDNIEVVIYTDFTNISAVQQLAKLANSSPRGANCDSEKAFNSFAGFTFVISASK